MSAAAVDFLKIETEEKMNKNQATFFVRKKTKKSKACSALEHVLFNVTRAPARTSTVSFAPEQKKEQQRRPSSSSSSCERY